MNKVFETLENFALVLIVVLGGFMTGFGASLVSSSSRLITPESFATSSSVVDYAASVSATNTTTTIVLDCGIFCLVGGTTSTTGTSYSWSNLTSNNGNYSFYHFRLAIVNEPYSSSSGFADSRFSYYICAYNNSAEYLKVYANGSYTSSITLDGMNYYLLGSFIYNSSNGETSVLDPNSGIYALRSQQASSWSTRVATKISFGNTGDTPVASSSNLPSLNLVSREIGNYSSGINPFRDHSTPGTGELGYLVNSYYNYLRWTDSNGFSFSLAIPVYYTSNDISVRPMWYYDYQKLYYYDGSVDSSTDSYYQQGYDTGYNSGYNVGYDGGYTDGNGDGYNNGYNSGYNQALTDDHYTFVNFLGAVVDAPVQAFRSLFDLEILGVNMLDFFSALLSICIVLLVIKFVFLR